MKLAAACIWLAGAAIPIALGAADADAALLAKALWLSLPFALLAGMWLRLRERGDRVAIVLAFAAAAAAEAWICRPVQHLAPFYFVPIVLFPIAAIIEIPALYYVVTGTAALRRRIRPAAPDTERGQRAR